jgi:hypothetical protein
LSFLELFPPVRLMGFEITLKTSHRIDKDAHHQAHERLD